MKRTMTRLVLFGSGAMLGLIGGALLFSPKAFLEMSHVFVEQEPGLMSELAAPGSVLVLAGGVMLMGAVRFRLASLALVVGAAVYGSYGLGRLVSMALYGLPPGSLIAATLIECAVALLLGTLWLATRPASKRSGIGAHAGLMIR